jgi:PAT family beta-lactamase induction signal transducer AmpG
MVYSFSETLRSYRHPQVLAMIFIGFSCYLPFLLTLSTLSFWLIETGFSKTTIGLFALAHLPHSFQFVWVPLIDHCKIPYLTSYLGKRRGWALFSQVCLMISLFALGSTDPQQNWQLTFILAFIVALFASCQEVVLSAYIFESFDAKHYPSGSALCSAGNRLSMLVSGAGAIHLSAFYSWGTVYKIMAAFIGIGIITILIRPEPPKIESSPSPLKEKNDNGNTFNKRIKVFYSYFSSSIHFFQKKPYWKIALLFIAIFKLGDSFVKIMDSKFYLEIGFTKQEIANATKIFGMTTSIIGGIIGTFLVNRWGILPGLFFCSVLHSLTNLIFLIQQYAGANLIILYCTIGIEDITGGMATMAFVVFLASLYTSEYRTIQNALCWSIVGFARSFFSAFAGWIAEHLDWTNYFLLSTLLSIPTLIVLKNLMKKIQKKSSLNAKESYLL